MHHHWRQLQPAVEPRQHAQSRDDPRPPQRCGVDEHVVRQCVPGRDVQHPRVDGGPQGMRRLLGRRGRRGLVFAGIGVAAASIAGAAFAFWASTDASNPAVAVADSIQAGNTPAVGLSNQDVTLTWTATTTASGASVTGYTVARYTASSGGTRTAATGGCSGTVTVLTCTEQSVPNGTWYYAVTPIISQWSGTESGRGSVTVTATVGAPSPTSGHTGDSVTISGSGFVASHALTVTVGGTSATITSGGTSDASGHASITFTVPTIPAGSKAVVVSDGTNTATSGTNFTVTPKITLSPTTGNVGTTVTVSGSGFGASKTITATYGGSS